MPLSRNSKLIASSTIWIVAGLFMLVAAASFAPSVPVWVSYVFLLAVGIGSMFWVFGIREKKKVKI